MSSLNTHYIFGFANDVNNESEVSAGVFMS
jgi:hypothetical protein